jgi:hypothetical protein
MGRGYALRTSWMLDLSAAQDSGYEVKKPGRAQN